MVRFNKSSCFFSIKGGGVFDRSRGPKNPLPYRAIGALSTRNMLVLLDFYLSGFNSSWMTA